MTVKCAVYGAYQVCLHKPNIYLKNGDPRISNVIKVNCSFVWVYFPGTTLIVKLVPVHTWHWFSFCGYHIWTDLLCTQEAGRSSYTAARHIRAPKHPVLSFCWADEGMVVGAVWSIVATQEGNVVSPGEKQANEKNILFVWFIIHV